MPCISHKNELCYNTQHVTKQKLMEEETHRELHEAALQGNAASLLKLLEVDSLVIERCAAGCFGQMPLHIAAMLGHLEFTTAMLDQKPELAKQLDSRRWSPLHLASANGHLQVVKALLLVDPDMCFAQDPDGWNPLHVAVIKDRVEVLKELVLAKPEAVLVPGEGGETLLHLCVKQSHLNALKFLVEFVNGMDCGVLNSKDNNGLTVLHLAVAKRQVEIVNFLLAKASIEVNALNANGSTALDISLAQCERKAKDINIQDSLLQAGAISVKYAFSTGCKPEAGNTRDSSTFGVHIRTLRNFRVKNSKKHHKRKNNNWLENKRTALMVVASLIATMALQAGINPPGGTWQGDQKGQVSGRLFEAGQSVMADKSPRAYTFFMTYNTVSFISSLSVILILISGLPIWRRSSVWLLTIIMWIAVISAMLAYTTSLYTLSKSPGISLIMKIIVMNGFYGAIVILVAGHFIRLRVKIIKIAKKLVKMDASPHSGVPSQGCQIV